MRDWERAVVGLLTKQLHVVSSGQVHACGGTWGSIKARTRSGEWDQVAPGVYRLHGAGSSWEQAVWIAHLAAGPASVVSHESAAQLLSLPRVRQGLVTLTVAPGAHPRVRGARFAESVDAPQLERIVVRGLPVTTPPRTIVDLAGRPEVSQARLEGVVDAAERERVATVAEVAAVAGSLRGRGRRGMGKLDALFKARAPHRPVPASELERQLWSVLRLAGLAEVATGQYPLPGFDLVGFADAAIGEARLILEADGRPWHEQRSRMVQDRDRDNQAAAEGWLTMRFMFPQLFGDPDGSAARIRATYGHRIGSSGPTWRLPRAVRETAH